MSKNITLAVSCIFCLTACCGPLISIKDKIKLKECYKRKYSELLGAEVMVDSDMTWEMFVATVEWLHKNKPFGIPYAKLKMNNETRIWSAAGLGKDAIAAPASQWPTIQVYRAIKNKSGYLIRLDVSPVKDEGFGLFFRMKLRGAPKSDSIQYLFYLS